MEKNKPLRLLVFKVAVLMGLAGLAALIIHPGPQPLSDTSLLGILLIIGGLTYGIIAAILTYVSWMQLINVQVSASKEAQLLGELNELSGGLSNRIEAQGIATGLRRYLETTLLDEWTQLSKGQSNKETQALFLDVTDRIRGLNTDDPRDSRLVDSMKHRLGAWSHQREKRVSWGLTRIPLPLWYYSNVLAVTIETLLLLYPSSSMLTHLVSVTLVAGILSWSQLMIRDLDNPFDGFWCLSPVPFEELSKRLKIQQQPREESIA